MAARQRDKKFYRVTFANEDEMYQVCARHVSSSDLDGLIEIGEFFFPENKLVYNPGEERIKREFQGISRTWLPFHSIIRIDEMVGEADGEIKILPLERKNHPETPTLLKKPEA